MKKQSAPSVPRSILEQYRDDISRCVKCGSCRAVCPSFLLEREESLSARGRMALITAVLDGRLAVSDIFEDRLASCTTCLACESTCASGVPVCGIIQAAKEQAVGESGTGFVKAIMSRVLKNEQAMRSLAWLAPLALHYSAESVKGGLQGPSSKFKACPRMTLSGVQSSKDAKGNQERTRTRGRVVLFAGCSVNYFQPDIGTAAIEVLSRIGYDVVVPEGLKCCGRPLLSLGDRRAAEEVAAHNASVLTEIDADAIVTACASCALTFKREYPKLLRPQGKAPALCDIHEFLPGRIGPDNVSPVRRTITWHDPCHLGRGQGLAKTARELISAIPGATFVEMENADRCCGFGGVMRMSHREASDRIADEKVKSIIGTKAAAIVTGCPSCRMQIRDGLRRAGSDIEVLHTVQLLQEALR